MEPVRIAVCNVKGGVAKTTTAVYLALGLAEQGRTLLIDADPGQGSALAWSEQAGEAWPSSCTVIPWATRDLARRVSEVAADYDHVVLDSGPKSPLLIRQAMSVADLAVVPVAPSPMDVADLPPTFDLAAEVDTAAVVLLAKVRRTNSAGQVRAMLDGRQVPTLTAEVKLSEPIVMAYGTRPRRLGAYVAVLAEVGALIRDGVTA